MNVVSSKTKMGVLIYGHMDGDLVIYLYVRDVKLIRRAKRTYLRGLLTLQDAMKVECVAQKVKTAHETRTIRLPLGAFSAGPISSLASPASFRKSPT